MWQVLKQLRFSILAIKSCDHLNIRSLIILIEAKVNFILKMDVLINVKHRDILTQKNYEFKNLIKIDIVYINWYLLDFFTACPMPWKYKFCVTE